MRHFPLLLVVCLLPFLARADDFRQSTALLVTATTDATEVHPDSIFEVTLTLENPTDTVQRIRIPEHAWDHVWKSSNSRVTWDTWDFDQDGRVTIEIQPHAKYVFPKPLRMFVQESVKASRLGFRMGFKTTTFGKTLWSAPITIEVIP
jgi:hypothetical protein